MRVLQLIDTLEAGGAERMAVNYANELANEIEFSGIVVTRKEGILKEQLCKKTPYFFINKTHTFDLASIFRLRKIIEDNNISFIHAHSTSFFTAFLVKLTIKTKLIWHDHYGDSEFLEKRKSFILRFCLLFFNGIIVVNEKLRLWAIHKLKFKNVIYLPNFVTETKLHNKTTKLQGIEGKKIVCLANLRAQKNHFLLLEIAIEMLKLFPDWTFHLVGKDFKDVYSIKLKETIFSCNLQNNVFLYDSVLDIENVLKQATIGVLTSASEGLPVALLEYGLLKLPVITTNVGEISSIIKNSENGFIVSSQDKNQFVADLIKLIENPELRLIFAKRLNKIIVENYSQKSVLKKYINLLNLVSKKQ